jgi:hypothetical protein
MMGRTLPEILQGLDKYIPKDLCAYVASARCDLTNPHRLDREPQECTSCGTMTQDTGLTGPNGGVIYACPKCWKGPDPPRDRHGCFGDHEET